MAQKEKQITKLTIIKNIYSKVNPKISANISKKLIGAFYNELQASNLSRIHFI